MAESYIITIKFQPTNQSLRETEKRLDNVFFRVTRNFKNALQKVWSGIKWAAGIGIATTAVTALLGKMGAVNDQVNALLNKAGNIKDRAESAGSSIETYGIVSGYAKSKGVDEETFNGLIARMQSMVGAAKAGEKNALWNYRNETDMARVFYNVMNQISSASGPAEKAAMASAVFGQRAVAQLGPLVTEGFGDEKLLKTLQSLDWTKYSQEVRRVDALGDRQAELAVRREMEQFLNLSAKTNEGTINNQNQYLRTQFEKDSAMYGNYKELVKLQQTADELEKAITNLSLKFSPLLTASAKGLEELAAVGRDFKDDPTNHLKTLATLIWKYGDPARASANLLQLGTKKVKGLF